MPPILHKISGKFQVLLTNWQKVSGQLHFLLTNLYTVQFHFYMSYMYKQLMDKRILKLSHVRD